MKMLSLFSGIGGIDLAAEWAGIEVVAFCEREPFCQKVLNKHWPDVPIFDDVITLNKNELESGGVDGTIDIVAGGYPCQPFSYAGNRKGETDDRHLWPEVKRLLQEIRPTWFIGENVAGHVTMGLDEVLSDLDDINYTAQPFIIPAAAVGAWHRRDRVFIVAHTNDLDRKTMFMDDGREIAKGIENERKRGKNRFGVVMDNPVDITKETSETIQSNIATYLHRKIDGVSTRLDQSRLKSLGNAVVPQQIYPIFEAIAKIEGVDKHESI